MKFIDEINILRNIMGNFRNLSLNNFRKLKNRGGDYNFKIIIILSLKQILENLRIGGGRIIIFPDVICGWYISYRSTLWTPFGPVYTAIH